MKPARFEYFAPSGLEEALSLLAEHGGEAKPLAGGQSLVPAMNFRLARPAVLVDLNRIPGLAHVAPGEDGGVRIGAMARQSAAERSPLVRERAPLLAEALGHVAHPQIRNRGTVGGSVAHADPAAELPAVLLALGAILRARGPEGERRVTAEEFFLGPFTTALAPDELLVEIELPAGPPAAGTGFHEAARRHGDFALAGAAAVAALDAEGRCAEARLVFFAVGGGPIRVPAAAGPLRGEPPERERIAEAALVAAGELDPAADVHASAEYRRHLAGVMGRRALEDAFRRASLAAGRGTHG